MRNCGVRVGLLMLSVVCVVSAQTANKPVAEQKRPNEQTDAVAMQISSELLKAVQVSNIENVNSSPLWKAAGLTYDVHMSDCEDRWVVLYHRPEDSDYTYGFVYIDPQAGFTLHFGGRFTIDADGKYRSAPNPIPPDK